MPVPHLDITATTYRLDGGLPVREHRWKLIAEVGTPGTENHPEIGILRDIIDDPNAPVWRQTASDNTVEFATLAMHPVRGLLMRVPVSEHQRIHLALSRYPVISLTINDGKPITLTLTRNSDD